MSNPHPNMQGLRPRWKKGEAPGVRISDAAARAVRLARRHCPEAIQFLSGLLNDESVTAELSVKDALQLRVKAAEVILAHGMPRGDNSRYLNEETIGGITITFVYPKGEEPKAIEGRALTINTVPAGTGD